MKRFTKILAAAGLALGLAVAATPKAEAGVVVFAPAPVFVRPAPICAPVVYPGPYCYGPVVRFGYGYGWGHPYYHGYHGYRGYGYHRGRW